MVDYLKKTFFSLLSPMLLAAVIGCTHTQLRKNTVHQSGSLSEIYQNQVLNNLAKFVRDPYALPDFSFPTEGISIVDDTGNVGFLVNWIWTGSGNNNIGGDIKRNMRETWTLEPIRDPRRLELMRCAYQHAVSSLHGFPGAIDCPSCCQRFNDFYTGDPSGMTVVNSNGKVTSQCLSSCRWFCFGTKNDVPAQCPRHLIGEHCGTYVWVCPGPGTNELTKLTLAILDYAVNKPRQPATKPSKKIVKTYTAKDGITGWTEEYHVDVNVKSQKKKKADDEQWEEFGPAEPGELFHPPDSGFVTSPEARSGDTIIVAPGGLQQSVQRLEAAGRSP